MRNSAVEGPRPGRAEWASRVLWFSTFEEMARALMGGQPFETLLNEAKAEVGAALVGAGFHPGEWAQPTSGYPCLRLTCIFKRHEALRLADELSGEAFEVSIDFTLAQSGRHCGLQLEVDIWTWPHTNQVVKTVLFSAVWEERPAPTLTAIYLDAQKHLRSAKLPPPEVFESIAAAVEAILVAPVT